MADAPNMAGMGGQLGGGITDLVSNLKGIVTNLSQLDTILNAVSTSLVTIGAINTAVAALNTTLLTINTSILSVFPRINGTFTLSAATTTVVTQTQLAANAMVFPFSTNATAALIVRTNGLFVSAVTSGASFSVSTQAGSATSGGTFWYVALNPS